MTFAILIAALVAVPCPQPHRSRGAVAQFRRLNPCPHGPDKGSTSRCRGYVVDHACPLSCCGIDAPQNMQYQTKAASKRKDRVERRCRRFCGRLNPPR
jgi:hypothetical protein